MSVYVKISEVIPPPMLDEKRRKTFEEKGLIEKKRKSPPNAPCGDEPQRGESKHEVKKCPNCNSINTEYLPVSGRFWCHNCYWGEDADVTLKEGIN